MKKIHEFRATNTYVLMATDVKAMNQIIDHYAALKENVACIAHDGKGDGFEFIVRLDVDGATKGGKVYDVRVEACGRGRVREIERVLIVDWSKVA